MNSKKLLVTITAAMAFVATSAFAAEIYKHTDENGNVHYGDRPTGDPAEETMHVASKRTDNTAVQRQFNERYAPKPKPAAEQQPATEEPAEAQKLTRAEKIAARKEREQTCAKNRDRMATLLNSRRLYREDESGERVYLDDAERQEARDKVQELIEQYCD
ncbi:MAG: DUF4124 domain-containing protein [Woeseiaceae bacterium]